MTVHTSRNDATIQRQVSLLTPTVTNSATYKAKLNTKVSRTYTADGSATAQEIVEGLQALLDANADAIAEIDEVAWTEDNATIIGTGAETGEPFTVLDGGGTAAFTPSTTTVAKSPNHWIAENFNSGTLPANGDTVVLTQLSSAQSYWWGLDQSAVALAALDIRADSEAQVGLPEFHASGYYQAAYRDTHLKVGCVLLEIGKGTGNGTDRLKILLNDATACTAIIYQTSTSRADQDEAPVHLAGSNAANALTMFGGIVDIAMLSGYTSQWATIAVSSGQLRLGSGATVATLDANGTSTVETRSGLTTLRTRAGGTVTHYAGNITTLDVQGGPVVVKASSALTIGTLNGYDGKTLDLTDCSAAVTVTNATIYASPGSPFTIIDPNNKLTMSNPASTPNGAQSMVVISGSGRNVRVT